MRSPLCSSPDRALPGAVWVPYTIERVCFLSCSVRRHNRTSRRSADRLKYVSAVLFERRGTMKTPASITTVVALVVMVLLVMGATDPHRSRDDSIARMEARIRSLERRVANLEKKLRASTVEPGISVRRLPIPPRSRSLPSPPRSSRRLPSPPPSQSLPEGWRRREFNGIPYYLVPLDQKQSRSRPSRPADN